MKACNCTLPYFNGPDVCLNCPNNYEYEGSVTYPYQQWGPKTKLIKRVTKTVDKYDNEGVLIGREVITEEYEEVEREEWGPTWPQEPWIISTSQEGTGGTIDSGHSFTTSAISIN